MDISLLKAIKAVNHMDSSRYRQEFFEYYIRRHLIARIVLTAYHLIQKSYLSAIIFALFGSRVFLINAFRQSKRLMFHGATDYKQWRIYFSKV